MRQPDQPEPASCTFDLVLRAPHLIGIHAIAAHLFDAAHLDALAQRTLLRRDARRMGRVADGRKEEGETRGTTVVAWRSRACQNDEVRSYLRRGGPDLVLFAVQARLDTMRSQPSKCVGKKQSTQPSPSVH